MFSPCTVGIHAGSFLQHALSMPSLCGCYYNLYLFFPWPRPFRSNILYIIREHLVPYAGHWRSRVPKGTFRTTFDQFEFDRLFSDKSVSWKFDQLASDWPGQRRKKIHQRFFRRRWWLSGKAQGSWAKVSSSNPVPTLRQLVLTVGKDQALAY